MIYQRLISVFKVKTSSSTLVEVTTALIIISMVFSLAIVIYVNVQKSGFSSRKFSCHTLMEDVLCNTVRKKEYVNKEVNYGDVIIYQEVEPYQSIDNLLMIVLEARGEDGKLLAEQKHLVYATKDE